jgi:hypothetical protein
VASHPLFFFFKKKKKKEKEEKRKGWPNHPIGGGWPALRPVWRWLGHPPMGWFGHPCFLFLFFFLKKTIIDLIFKIKLKN